MRMMGKAIVSVDIKRYLQIVRIFVSSFFYRSVIVVLKSKNFDFKTSIKVNFFVDVSYWFILMIHICFILVFRLVTFRTSGDFLRHGWI